MIEMWPDSPLATLPGQRRGLAYRLRLRARQWSSGHQRSDQRVTRGIVVGTGQCCPDSHPRRADLESTGRHRPAADEDDRVDPPGRSAGDVEVLGEGQRRQPNLERTTTHCLHPPGRVRPRTASVPRPLAVHMSVASKSHATILHRPIRTMAGRVRRPARVAVNRLDASTASAANNVDLSSQIATKWVESPRTEVGRASVTAARETNVDRDAAVSSSVGARGTEFDVRSRS
jgi:hypothetical protein